MCGIFGYIGSKKASPILARGLKNLEYRGYDSVGIATVASRLEIRKDVGKIDDLKARLNLDDVEGNVGIGHTRWATHGAVTTENAHPHTDCDHNVAIIHNGILENYYELKTSLVERGHRFSSDTDSEVIAHLIEEQLSNNGSMSNDGSMPGTSSSWNGSSFEHACVEAFKQLRGSFAVLAVREGEEKIVAARKDSPLVVGLAEHGTFFASDVAPFLDWTKDVVYLENGDLVVADRDDVKFSNLDFGEVARPVSTVGWDLEEAKKGNFEHFMLKEISEQAETIQRACIQDMAVVDRIAEMVRSGFGVFFVACGSSYHACLTGSYLFSKVAKLHVNVVLASEFENYEHFLTENTLVFAVSQSGETADVLEAVRAAKKRGSRIVSITNVMGSSLSREGDELLLMNSGPEICVLSTKTYTSQVVMMALLACALKGDHEACIRKVKDLYMDVYNLTARSMRDRLKALALDLASKDHAYMIGRGLQYTTALEAALKVKEVSYIHTEAFAGGELKHGPLALIEEGTPVFVFVSRDNEDRIISNAQEVKARGGFVIGVSDWNSPVFDRWIKVPDCGDLNPVIQAIPMQVLAYELAVQKNLDPDKPRNLAKSVTVL
jgi:glucosamine--fructose-6-phosphate aminotransferase (isomerizing)